MLPGKTEEWRNRRRRSGEGHGRVKCKYTAPEPHTLPLLEPVPESIATITCRRRHHDGPRDGITHLDAGGGGEKELPLHPLLLLFRDLVPMQASD